MEITDVGKALSNPTRVNILKLLCGRPYSASELHRKYIEQYDDDKHRESIYRELENLKEFGLVKKKYKSDEKSLYYEILSTRLLIDLEKLEVAGK